MFESLNVAIMFTNDEFEIDISFDGIIPSELFVNTKRKN